MSTRIEDPALAIDTIIRILRREAPAPEGLSKMRALLALRRSRSSRKVAVLSELLADPEELPRYKHMAVTGLLELGGARAEEALTENAPLADELTAAPMALALARVGSPGSARVIHELRARTAPAAAKRADFAVSLLAYRHGLSGDDVETPSVARLMPVPPERNSLPMVLTPARGSDLGLAAEALGREPLGLEITGEGAQRIECGPNRYLLVWNEEFGGSRFTRLWERKGIGIVLFLKDRFEEELCISSLVLATPRAADLGVSVHKPWGEMVWAGVATLENERVARLALRSVRQPGASAIELSGSIAEGRLEVEEARSGRTVVDRKQPVPDPDRKSRAVA